MWERIAIAIVIELVKRKASTNQIDGEDLHKIVDFHKIVKLTKNPPKTLEKLFENPIVSKIAVRVFVDMIERHI